MRTQEQFGYIVSVKSYSFSGFSKSAYFTDFISFIVQSPNKTSSEIIQRTEDFIQDFYSFLKNLSDADFTNYVTNIANTLKNTDTSIIDASNDSFINILLHNTSFDYYNIIIQTMNKITKHELCDFYDTHFLQNKHAITICISPL